MSAIKDFVADHCAEYGLGTKEAMEELQQLWSESAALDERPSSDDDVIWPPIQENGVLIAR